MSEAKDRLEAICREKAAAANTINQALYKMEKINEAAAQQKNKNAT